jgi:16S rRNA (adenine1518-N6/adenine1519-N6)-dimethyltransferase
MIHNDLVSFANKSFGQNFLKDSGYIHKIIQAMPKDRLKIAEIGPGLGDLTKELLIAQRNVTAFEVDNRLCEHLNSTFKASKENGFFKLKCGDVLEHWKDRSLLNEPYHLVANLPYYIATKIILKAFKDEQCQSILVMVQKEVAEKFAAKTKQKAFSALSVLAQSVGGAQICFEVEPQAFVPPPKVTSAVLLITKRETKKNEGFEAFLAIAFKQPRKTLMKNLTQSFSKALIEKVFKECGLKTTLRPHEATTSIYYHLYTILKDTLDGQNREAERKPRAESKSTKTKKRKPL